MKILFDEYLSRLKILNRQSWICKTFGFNDTFHTVNVWMILNK